MTCTKILWTYRATVTFYTAVLLGPSTRFYCFLKISFVFQPETLVCASLLPCGSEGRIDLDKASVYVCGALCRKCCWLWKQLTHLHEELSLLHHGLAAFTSLFNHSTQHKKVHLIPQLNHGLITKTQLTITAKITKKHLNIFANIFKYFIKKLKQLYKYKTIAIQLF